LGFPPPGEAVNVTPAPLAHLVPLFNVTVGLAFTVSVVLAELDVHPVAIFVITTL
jgi:hypothetical protein